jgi:hypothetical protein
MESVRASEGLAGRGVWEAPYLVDGYPALIAVDSRGVARKHAKLLSGASYARVKAALEALLDRIDPVPQLALVRDGSAARRSIALPPVHPAHRDDYHAYRRRLVKQLSHRVLLFRD